MQRFRVWFENNLRRDQQEQVQRLYDMTVRQLLGSARDQTHLSLSDIEDDAGPDQPPSSKGALVAYKKLEKAQIFEKMKQLGNPDLAARADAAQNYLQKAGQDQIIGPKDTVGQLLNRMFGDDAVETYGDRTWESAPRTPSQKPQQPSQPAPAQPEPTAQPTMPQAPASPTPQPMPQAPTMQLPAAPMPVMPQDPASMMMQPPSPQMPLQSPGGPMPPMPPGGLAMS